MSYISTLDILRFDILRIVIDIIGFITIIKFIRRMQIVLINYIKERFKCIKLMMQTTYNKIQVLIDLPTTMLIIALIITYFKN
jgi:hypothetical protein